MPRIPLNSLSDHKQLCLECNLFLANPMIGKYCSNCFQDLDILSNYRQRKSSFNTEADENLLEITFDLNKKHFFQVNSSLCWFCGKKTGLHSYKCRCKFNYCKRHRLPEKHECEFDFINEGKNQIRKNNPKIKKKKVLRI